MQRHEFDEDDGAELKRQDFARRFAAHMVKRTGGRTDRTNNVMQRANQVCGIYFANHYRALGTTPEECAEIELDRDDI